VGITITHAENQTRAWKMQPTGATTRALAAGADWSSDGNGSSSDHNFGIKKKRSGDSKVSPATLGIKKKRPKDSKATVVITDQYSFQETVQKFTGMPTPPAGSTSEESKRRPLLFKPRAQRAEINVPLTTFPALSSVLMNSTYCCSLPFSDHVLEFPLIEGEHPNIRLESILVILCCNFLLSAITKQVITNLVSIVRTSSCTRLP